MRSSYYHWNELSVHVIGNKTGKVYTIKFLEFHKFFLDSGPVALLCVVETFLEGVPREHKLLKAGEVTLHRNNNRACRGRILVFNEALHLRCVVGNLGLIHMCHPMYVKCHPMSVKCLPMCVKCQPVCKVSINVCKV